jgi:hypothetical protein
MKNYIPTSLHPVLRFTATLRHPISRDLSWFNVLNQELYGFKTDRMREIKQRCYSTNASHCYSMYSNFSIYMYDTCKKTAELHLEDIELFKKNVTEEIMQTQGIRSFRLKDEYWMEAFIYSKCYQSSILRTGGILHEGSHSL